MFSTATATERHWRTQGWRSHLQNFRVHGGRGCDMGTYSAYRPSKTTENYPSLVSDNQTNLRKLGDCSQHDPQFCDALKNNNNYYTVAYSSPTMNAEVLFFY